MTFFSFPQPTGGLDLVNMPSDLHSHRVRCYADFLPPFLPAHDAAVASSNQHAFIHHRIGATFECLGFCNSLVCST